MKRKLDRVYTPPAHQGFMGPDHTARAVIQGHFSQSDPFIMLMDDRLDKKNNDPVGGPHPHAGFETVTLLIEGEFGEADHKLKSGDFQMMTAGSGIVHTETIDKKAKLHLLQLWLTLPKKDRWTTPRVQEIHFEEVPKISENGLDIRVYSGSLAGLQSPVLNHVPVIIADIKMQQDVSSIQSIPAHYNTFLYVLEGTVKMGEENKILQAGQAGWLERLYQEGESEVQITAGDGGARFVLYSGEPQGDPIISHGPFIGDSEDDIRRLYSEFRQGKMKHVSTLPQAQVLNW